MITDTSSDSCEIEIRGLAGGMDYTFTLAGVAPRDGGSYGSVRGYFDTPDIADELTEEDDTGDDDEEESSGSETEKPQEPTAEVTQPETQPAPTESSEKETEVTEPEEDTAPESTAS